jgi:hypothetical protein
MIRPKVEANTYNLTAQNILGNGTWTSNTVMALKSGSMESLMKGTSNTAKNMDEAYFTGLTEVNTTENLKIMN